MLRNAGVHSLIFDLDGTLFNHDAAMESALHYLYRKIAPPPTWTPLEFTAFLRMWSTALEHHYNRYLAGELSHEAQRMERVKDVWRTLGRPCGDDEARRLFAGYLAEYEAAWRLYDDAVPCLSQLDAFRLGIITNGDDRQQRAKIRATGLEPYFSSIVTSGRLGIAKPDARIFAYAVDQLGVEGRAAVYIGDRLETDALGARDAGMHGIWLRRPGQNHGGKMIKEAESAGVSVIPTLAALPGLVASMALGGDGL